MHLKRELVEEIQLAFCPGSIQLLWTYQLLFSNHMSYIVMFNSNLTPIVIDLLC